MTTVEVQSRVGPLARWRSRPQIEKSSSRAGLAVLAVALVVLFQVTIGGFATWGNGVSILTNSAPLLVAAIAAARLLISGVIDLSIAGSYALLTVTVGWLLNTTHSTPLAIAGTLLAGALIGLINGNLAQRININPIIITIALGLIYTGVALASTNGSSYYGFHHSFLVIAQGSIWGIPYSVLIAMSVFVVSSLALTRTVSGVRSYAIGGNANACRLNGIRVSRHRLLLFVGQQVAMAVVAILTASQVGSANPTTGTGFEIATLTAIMIGGTAFTGGGGKPVGIFVGVLTIGILQAGFVFAGFNSYVQEIAQGSLLILALTADQVVAWRRGRAKKSGVTAGDKLASTVQTPLEPLRGAPLGPVVLKCSGLAKAYGAVVAVRNVGFEVRAGEVVCLVGDNGAGKSTVIKMLSGVTSHDSGTICVNDREVRFSTPADARAAGIETVYQELALAQNLGAALNLNLGREPRKRWFGWLGLIDLAAAARIAAEGMSKLGIVMDDYFRPISSFSGGQRQSTAIARAAIANVNVMILDEPTAALGVRQTGNVLGLIKRVAANGAGVILITHDVELIMNVAQRVVVVALGETIFDGPAVDLTVGKLIHLMAGYAPVEKEREQLDANTEQWPVENGHSGVSGAVRASRATRTDT